MWDTLDLSQGLNTILENKTKLLTAFQDVCVLIQNAMPAQNNKYSPFHLLS